MANAKNKYFWHFLKTGKMSIFQVLRENWGGGVSTMMKIVGRRVNNSSVGGRGGGGSLCSLNKSQGN